MALLYDLIEIGILNYDNIETKIVCLPEPFFCKRYAAIPLIAVCNPPNLLISEVTTFKAAFPLSTITLKTLESKVIVENS